MHRLRLKHYNGGEEKIPRRAICGDTQTLLAKSVDSNVGKAIFALFPKNYWCSMSLSTVSLRKKLHDAALCKLWPICLKNFPSESLWVPLTRITLMKILKLKLRELCYLAALCNLTPYVQPFLSWNQSMGTAALHLEDIDCMPKRELQEGVVTWCTHTKSGNI